MKVLLHQEEHRDGRQGCNNRAGAHQMIGMARYWALKLVIPAVTGWAFSDPWVSTTAQK